MGLFNAGTVENLGSAASITGAASGVVIAGGGVVVNQGTIRGAGSTRARVNSRPRMQAPISPSQRVVQKKSQASQPRQQARAHRPMVTAKTARPFSR